MVSSGRMLSERRAGRGAAGCLRRGLVMTMKCLSRWLGGRGWLWEGEQSVVEAAKAGFHWGAPFHLVALTACGDTASHTHNHIGCCRHGVSVLLSDEP